MARLPRFDWTVNRALAAAALLLGTLALFGHPQPGHAVRIDTREMANIVAREVDHVDLGELADWIIRGDAGYRLIDLRKPEEFEAYHIPTAENVPLAGLMDAGIGRDERIVLYSEGGIHAAQAWFLLRAERYPAVYTLRGGLEGWKDEVLYPVSPVEAMARQTAAFERSAYVARFFGGSPRAAVTGGEATPAIPPQVAAEPAPPSVAAPARPGGAAGGGKPPRKKKEGC